MFFTLLFSSVVLRAMRLTLFPYTTLFRSFGERLEDGGARPQGYAVLREAVHALVVMLSPFAPHTSEELWERLGRSEEHTSELQSLRHLVCRLLLEKKKKRKNE